MTARAEISRREVANYLDVHPDSVTRLLSSGLAAAVLKWGGRGQRMIFARDLVERWLLAWTCRAAAGQRCWTCEGSVLYDCVAVAEHLLEQRHGYGGCRECRVTWRLAQPCRA